MEKLQHRSNNSVVVGWFINPIQQQRAYLICNVRKTSIKTIDLKD